MRRTAGGSVASPQVSIRPWTRPADPKSSVRSPRRWSSGRGRSTSRLPAMDLGKTAEQAVDAALSAGAGDAEAYVQDSVGREIRVFEGEVESLTEAGERGLGVRCWIDHRVRLCLRDRAERRGSRRDRPGAVEAARIADPDEFAAAPAADGAADPPRHPGPRATRRSASGRPSARSSSPRRSSGRRARPTSASTRGRDHRLRRRGGAGRARLLHRPRRELRGDHRLRLPPGDRRRRRRQADRPRLRHGPLAGGPRRRGDRPRGRGARGLAARRRQARLAHLPGRPRPDRRRELRRLHRRHAVRRRRPARPLPVRRAASATRSPRRPSPSPTTPPTPPASTHRPSTPRAPPAAERR